jgi:t-SNARE complex subunit (syntaxin)
LDQIEYQVKSATDYVEEGNVKLVEAIDLQISIRRKQLCICFTILLIVGIVVGLAIAGSQGSL